MIDGVKKMEADMRDGMAYSSAIQLEDEDEDERNCEEPSKKKNRTINSNKRTSSRKKEEPVQGRRRKGANGVDVIIRGSRPVSAH